MAQYEHRKLMMKVNQQLGSEEFDSLVYLMCVPDEIVEATQSDHNHTRVLRYLEKQNIIGPHNYHCLVDALDTLGRCDLIMQIASADPEGVVAKLPYTPQSIQPQQLVWLAKQQFMLDRKEKYISYMKDLAVIVPGSARENRLGDLFLGLFSALTSEQNQILPQCEESAVAALTEMSLFWKQWPSTIATFQQSGDSCHVKSLMTNCHSCFDHFNCELPPSWEIEAREHVVVSVIGRLVREAHSALHEISAELIGEQPLKEANKATKDALLILESAHYTTQHLIPITKWLMTVVHSTSLSATDAKKMYAALKVILSDHSEDITRNKDILVEIFGEEVMYRISHELLQDWKGGDSGAKYNFDIPTHTSIIRTFTVVWHVAVVMLIMMSMDYKIDHRAIQQKLAEFLVSQKQSMMQLFVQMSRRMTEIIRRGMEQYKETCEQKISQLVRGAPETLEIVQSLFTVTF